MSDREHHIAVTIVSPFGAMAGSGAIDGSPDNQVRGRHLDVANAKLAECMHNGVDDGGAGRFNTRPGSSAITIPALKRGKLSDRGQITSREQRIGAWKLISSVVSAFLGAPQPKRATCSRL
jgi:hypothetical protein